MTKFKYILFDLDGTVADSREGICKSVQFALHQQGIKEPNLKKCEPFIGVPLKQCFMERYGMTQEQAFRAVIDYRSRYQPIGLYESHVYKGMPELLDRLKEQGCKLGLIADESQDIVEKILKQLKLTNVFDVVMGTTAHDGIENKAALIEQAMETLHAKEEDTLMVGDRKYDALAARACGIRSVGVGYGFAEKMELELGEASYLVKSVKQLERFFQSTQVDKWKNKYKRSSKLDLLNNKREWEIERKAEQEKPLPTRIWNILMPVLLYMGITLIAGSVLMLLFRQIELYTPIGSFLIRHSQETAFVMSALPKILGGAFLVPMLYKERLFWKGRVVVSPLTVLLLFIGLSLFLNIVISQLKLYVISEAYMETAKMQYAVPVWQGILLFGVISPVVEEILFRGLVYNRLKRLLPTMLSILLSAILFGLYHFNLVQGIYGFLMGCMIAYIYEETGDLRMAILSHAVSNIVVFLVTYQDSFAYAFASPMNAIILAFVAISSFWNIRRRRR